jgi:RNA-binding protein YhbY
MMVQAVQANGPQLIKAQVQANMSQSPKMVQQAVAVRNQVQAVQLIGVEDNE